MYHIPPPSQHSKDLKAPPVVLIRSRYAALGPLSDILFYIHTHTWSCLNHFPSRGGEWRSPCWFGEGSCVFSHAHWHFPKNINLRLDERENETNTRGLKRRGRRGAAHTESGPSLCVYLLPVSTHHRSFPASRDGCWRARPCFILESCRRQRPKSARPGVRGEECGDGGKNIPYPPYETYTNKLGTLLSHGGMLKQTFGECNHETLPPRL